MRVLKTLLIGLLFISCNGQVKEPVYVNDVNYYLRPYVMDYLRVLDSNNIKFKKQNFIVVFDADIMVTNLLGLAKGMFNNDLLYVKINPRLWEELTHKQKRHLIFHELSHDLFNIEHTEDIELMRPSMASPIRSFSMNIEKEIINLMNHIKNEQS